MNTGSVCTCICCISDICICICLCISVKLLFISLLEMSVGTVDPFNPWHIINLHTGVYLKHHGEKASLCGFSISVKSSRCHIFNSIRFCMRTTLPDKISPFFGPNKIQLATSERQLRGHKWAQLHEWKVREVRQRGTNKLTATSEL